MNSEQIITTYELILDATGKMLEAAQSSDWDGLVLLEKKCKVLTKKLIKDKPQQELSAELKQKKIKIIHQILARDAKIREFTEPWMMRLQNILNTAGHKRNLQQACQTGN